MLSRFHPEIRRTSAEVARDVEAAKALMERRPIGFEHEIHHGRRRTGRRTRATHSRQLRDAGFRIQRTVLPGSTFWNDGRVYPSLASPSGEPGRPLGIQVIQLAYRNRRLVERGRLYQAGTDEKIAQALTIADA